MIRVRQLLSLLFAAALTPVLAQAADHAAHEWGYDGATGPSHWNALKSEYATCKMGHQQSPIDIRATKKEKLPELNFDYHAVPLKVIDNGHTIQVGYAPGSGMTVNGVHYDLLQFHFHTPSEEHIRGKAYPLVAHLVHKNAEGKLAVVAVLFKQGKTNPVLSEVFSHLPAGPDSERADPDVSLDVANLLPAAHGYYNFAGSLTTPPCSEEVNWFVLKTPVEMSAAQIKQFHARYKHNARPVQPLHGRVVKESL